MMTQTERSDRITSLTPRQGLDVVQYMSAWLGDQASAQEDYTPEEQVEILNGLFQEEGYAPLPLSTALKPNEELTGLAAKQVLMSLAESGDETLLAELDHWLVNPPKTQTKAVIEVIVVPVVLTACIMALGTGYTFNRAKNGKITGKVKRDPVSMKDLAPMLSGFYGAVKTLIGLS